MRRQNKMGTQNIRLRLCAFDELVLCLYVFFAITAPDALDRLQSDGLVSACMLMLNGYQYLRSCKWIIASICRISDFKYLDDDWPDDNI